MLNISIYLITFTGILFNVNVALKSSYWGDHDWHANDTDDAAARKAYEALLR